MVCPHAQRKRSMKANDLHARLQKRRTDLTAGVAKGSLLPPVHFVVIRPMVLILCVPFCDIYRNKKMLSTDLLLNFLRVLAEAEILGCVPSFMKFFWAVLPLVTKTVFCSV